MGRWGTSAAVVLVVALTVWRDQPAAATPQVVEVVGEQHGFVRIDSGERAGDVVARLGGVNAASEPIHDGQRLRVLPGGHVHIEAADPLLFGERVDLNHADRQALMALEGVGASRATAIEAARPYQRPADLRRARGIGARSVTALAPLVQTVDVPEQLPPARVPVNHASEAELEALPRVGPVLAARIIEERERRGPFTSASDLQRVRGIGPVLSERLAPLVELP